MARFVVLIAVFLFLINAAHAQDNLTGRIYENKKRVALPGIVVQNLNSHSTVISDRTGGFSIPAKVGDLVVFSNFSYQPDTLYVKDLNYIEISLDLKSNMLKEVQVTGSETRLGNLKAAPKLSPISNQALEYTTDAAGNPTGGITANIFDSHSDEKKRNKIAQFEKDDKTRAKIARIFNADSLQNYLPIRGQEMDNFIQLYTPDTKTFTAPAFNLMVYINDSYKKFLAIPPEKRKAKLEPELK
jgi:hypothetical protein